MEENDRFCGQCGAALGRDETAHVLEDDEDPLAEWERHRSLRGPVVPDDQAPTESIPAARPGDTAVLPEVPPAEPAPPPGLSPAPPPVAIAPRRGFPLGATLALIGGIAVILSAILPWTTAAHPDLAGPVLPRDIGFLAVLLGGGTDRGGPSLGIVLLGAGVAGGLMALLTMVAPALKVLRRLIGLATLAIPALFVFRVAQGFLGEPGAPALVVQSLAAGVYVAAAGALVQMVAGRWFRR